MTTRRIQPWIRNMILMLLALLLATQSVFAQSIYAVHGENMAAPQAATNAAAYTVSNITDTSVTISWLTPLSTTGQVRYGSGTPTIVVEDDRGAGTSSYTHLVTISGLTPGTTYSFDLISGSVVDNNGGAHYQFTTGTTLSPGMPDTAYGVIYLSNGVTPAVDALVCLTIADSNGSGTFGQSTPLCVLSNANGEWGVNLSSVRATALNAYFSYSVGDQIAFRVDTGNGYGAVTTMVVGNHLPAPNIVLTPATPSLVGIAPNYAYPGDVVDVALTGSATHWQNGITTVDFGPGITASLTVTDATHALAYITVAGNATVAPRSIVMTTGTEQVTSNNAFNVRGLGVPVSLPVNASGTQGEQLQIPIHVGACAPVCYSFETTIEFNQTVLAYAGFVQTNTLTTNWPVSSNIGNGSVKIVGYGTNPLNTSGTLITLLFDIVGTPGMQSDLTFGAFQFNDGDPAVTVANGLVTVVEHQSTLAGKVVYSQSILPVPGVLLNAGAPLNPTSTNALGIYSFTLASGHDYTVAPTKIGDLQNALSSLDAAYIAQYTVGRRVFSSEQILACDVSANGVCNVYDASLVARYLVNSVDYPASAKVGQWQFTPPSRLYSQLNANLTNEDYKALIIGDVTQNWAKSAALLPDPNPLLVQESMKIGLPKVNTRSNSAIAIPLVLSNLTNHSIFGYQIELQYDPKVVMFENINQANTLSSAWSVIEEHSQPGLLKLVGYGIDPLSGDGDLLYVNFKTLGKPGQGTNMNINVLILNEGFPTADAIHGSVKIDAGLWLPIITR